MSLSAEDWKDYTNNKLALNVTSEEHKKLWEELKGISEVEIDTPYQNYYDKSPEKRISYPKSKHAEVLKVLEKYKYTQYRVWNNNDV